MLNPEVMRQLAALRNDLAAEERKNPTRTGGSAEYPPKIETTEQKTKYNTQTIAEWYERALPGKGLEEAFQRTYEDTIEELTAGKKRRALEELRLLTEVERLILEGDRKHINLFTPERVGSQSIIVRVGLEGISFNLQDGRGRLRSGRATAAEIRIDPTGLRLRVDYEDPFTGDRKFARTGTDFHYLRVFHLSPEERGRLGITDPDTTIKTLSLDIKGRYLTHSQRDYHHPDHFAELGITEENFGQLRTAYRRLVTEESG